MIQNKNFHHTKGSKLTMVWLMVKEEWGGNAITGKNLHAQIIFFLSNATFKDHVSEHANK